MEQWKGGTEEKLTAATHTRRHATTTMVAHREGGTSSVTSSSEGATAGPLPLPPPPPQKPEAEARRSTASRIHCEAEKRRRDRINAHLSTLRCMIPNSGKMDKASLLATVIEQVKDLKRKASDISRVSKVPREVNEVSVECSISDNIYIEASVCCEDRPHLFAELSEAFHSLRLRTIRAELISLGGRVHNVFTLCLKKGSECVNLSSFKEAIRQALDMVVASSDEEPSSGVFSKRRRSINSHHSSI